MTPEMMQKTIALLIKHEGEKKRAYIDSRGNITAGMGHNLSARDIEQDIIEKWKKDDILEFYTYWHDTFPWYRHLNEARQIALIDFSFIGWQKVLEFKQLIDCLFRNDMTGAAEQILNSSYATQVGARAKDIANILINGEL
jgi:lysozyme